MSYYVAGAFIIGTLYTADQQKESAKQEEYNLEYQAEQEKLQSVDEEVVRRKRLNKILSASIASTSTTVGGIGTPESLALSNAKTASFSEGAESVSDQIRQDLLRREAKDARNAGRVRSTATLIGGTTRAYSLL